MIPSSSECVEKATRSSSSSSLCQECSKHFFRYQCPRCSHRTCSLACCKAHKKRTGCNGKRDRTKFLPVARMNDATLTSDYYFLEDAILGMERAKRNAEVGGGSCKNGPHSNQSKRAKHHQHLNPRGDASSVGEDKTSHPMLQQIEGFQVSEKNRFGEQVEENQTNVSTEIDTNNNATLKASVFKPMKSLNDNLPPNSVHQLGAKWKFFWQQASLRGTRVLLMPAGMQRRKANSSHVKQNIIYWKIDVRFHATKTTTMTVLPAPTVHSIKVCEEAILCHELQSKLKTSKEVSSGSNHKVPEEPIHWLMKKLPSPSNCQFYIEIVDQEATLQSILKGQTIIEYPTVEAVPASRIGEFPRSIEEVNDDKF